MASAGLLEMFGLRSLATGLVLLALCLVPTFQLSGFALYSQPCQNNETCYAADFRLVCHNSTAVCQCSRFYYWNETFRECHLNATQLNVWFNNHKERHISDELNDSASAAFISIALSGILSISLGTCLAILCVLYACMFRHVVHETWPPPRPTGPAKPKPQPSADKTK
ncbi:hypothetical protein M8J75_000846 [Diaphorina citri]|nr:hypothetical protein M8J75_000846 [Diaphorina citri]